MERGPQGIGETVASQIYLYLPDNLPTVPDRMEGKFLQLQFQDTVFLLFAPKTLCPYHVHLLARFATEHGIAHHWRDDQSLDISHPRLNVLGGGKFRLNLENQTLTLYDDSQAYGRFRDDQIIQQVAEADHAWSRLALIVA